MRIQVGFILVLVFLVNCSPEKKVQKAFKYGKYEQVIAYYKGILAKNRNSGKANYFIAESYRLSNRIKEAEPFYAKAGGPGIIKDSVHLFYAKALQANAKYEESKKVLEELAATTEDEKIKDRAQKEIDGLQYLANLSEKKSYFRVK